MANEMDPQAVRAVQKESLEIANAMHAVMHGRGKAPCLLAIGMILGWTEAQTERPDLDRLFRVLRIGAQETFDRERLQKEANDNG